MQELQNDDSMTPLIIGHFAAHITVLIGHYQSCGKESSKALLTFNKTSVDFAVFYDSGKLYYIGVVIVLPEMGFPIPGTENGYYLYLPYITSSYVTRHW